MAESFPSQFSSDYQKPLCLKMSRNFIQSFKSIPETLFRVNAGRSIKLRDLALRKRHSYDVLSQGGMVQPKALSPATYKGACSKYTRPWTITNTRKAPNGASMRPMSEYQSQLVQSYKGKDIVVYALDEGMFSFFFQG